MEWTIEGPYAQVFAALAGLVYAAAASAFSLKTLLEGYASRGPWDVWRIAGLALCIVWPVLLVGLLWIAWRAAQAARKAPATHGPARKSVAAETR